MTDLAATVRKRGVYQLNSEQDAALAELVRLAEQRGEAEALRRSADAALEAVGGRVERLEEALRPFVEKWDLHAADYLAKMVDGEEARVLPARVVTEMIQDQRAARAALAEVSA